MKRVTIKCDLLNDLYMQVVSEENDDQELQENMSWLCILKTKNLVHILRICHVIDIEIEVALYYRGTIIIITSLPPFTSRFIIFDWKAGSRQVDAEQLAQKFHSCRHLIGSIAPNLRKQLCNLTRVGSVAV